ncbi:putative sulfurtransferase [secondary endosymbiont of Heteropsylla cubana]|uniref:tRNA uridine(34) hydroxylase n=1 Tax=secondary endosymbiont of Heteropsylla cubana TaxID=134287 RepID=J3TYS0_9ENTR|nr:rhodanese-related sulfurtransferase [secondary endosymbiont of Heteropsylla cubana]AFP85565.1 putative sulfurtransferase [secondary endosymbiont of Heteropsylla cubana]
MSLLYNQISNKELRMQMLAENHPRTTVSFYRYFNLSNPKKFRDILYQKFISLNIFGRVYIAHEGINAQISVPKHYFNNMCKTVYEAHPDLDKIRMNVALDDNGKSFWVLRMKVRSRIVADGINNFTFNPKKVGVYLDAEEVNTMSDDPNTLFVDIRNHYEYEVGHFFQAIEIPSDTFRQQLPTAVQMLRNHKDKKIVIYCTGGIRCEKASSWMLYNGFKYIYQIDGGIINYIHSIRKKKLPTKFIGKIFVFDERLGERITSDVIAHCYQCNTPYDSHTNCRNQFCNRLFIQCLSCLKEYLGCCSINCQKKFTLSEKSRHVSK